MSKPLRRATPDSSPEDAVDTWSPASLSSTQTDVARSGGITTTKTRKDSSVVESIVMDDTRECGALTISIDARRPLGSILNTDEVSPVTSTSASSSAGAGTREAPVLALVGENHLLSEALQLALPRLGIVACSINARQFPPEEISRLLIERGVRVAVVVLTPESIPGALQRISALASGGLEVLGLSPALHPAVADACREAGMRATLSTSDPLDVLTRAVSSVLASLPGEAQLVALDGAGSVGESGRAERERIERLTAREREVLGYLLDGVQTKVIARKLGVKLSTARSHVAAILRKLEVNSQIQVAAIARRAGWPL